MVVLAVPSAAVIWASFAPPLMKKGPPPTS
jgi:hypothetical protein